MDKDLRAYADFLEGLSPQTLATLDRFVTPDVRFSDPFNDVAGVDAMRRVFQDMFETVDHLRFTVTDAMREGEGGFIRWDFRFEPRRFRGRGEWIIPGVSHLGFAPDGRVYRHADYWDAAGQLYARFPVIGPVMRWLARRNRTE